MTTMNRDVLVRDPTTNPIPNDGVVTVANPATPEEWQVLRRELETFVCDGEYRDGLERILATFLGNLDQARQPAAWVSGFYGSGKSHLARVLEYLWKDYRFEDDAARARDLPADMDQDIQAHLRELSRRGQLEGGLWSAAGTLSAGPGSVRIAFLQILFKSADLPPQYPAARLVLWLKSQGCFEAVEQAVARRGKTLEGELRDMYVSTVLAAGILDVIPEFAAGAGELGERLMAQFPPSTDISNDEVVSTMEDVLGLMSERDGRLPLTLVVLDELQQFIGDDQDRISHVLNLVEACTSRFRSHVLFLATGQSALPATRELQKLQGRFSTVVHLSDADVQGVVRKVVLRKSPHRRVELEEILDGARGEIDRHLAGTTIGLRGDEDGDRYQDYPLLPKRLRLWEAFLRAVDQAGTAGQLRTQLRVVHDAVSDVAEAPLGTVVRGDTLYWHLEGPMQESAVLARDTATTIRSFMDGTGDDGMLRARLCALAFLLGKLDRKNPDFAGVGATADILADLLVEDLGAGSSAVREQVQIALQGLVDDGTLMQIEDEYRLQTVEGAAWDSAYLNARREILSDQGRRSEKRRDEFRKAIDAAIPSITATHGDSNTPWEYYVDFSPEPPASEGRVPVWIQDGWSTTETAVRESARRAGLESPTVFVFLPRENDDALSEAIARSVAARATVENPPTSGTPEAEEQRAAMESRARHGNNDVSTIATRIVEHAKVYQGGGNELTHAGFGEHVKEALHHSLARMFPRFTDGDAATWHNVFDRAVEGAPDPLASVDHHDEVAQHPVCREILERIGAQGVTGQDVRKHFEAPPYGWPRDSVNGGLIALLGSGLLRATRFGKPLQARGLTRQEIGPAEFFLEQIVVNPQHRVGIRELAQRVGVDHEQGREPVAARGILERLFDLAKGAGGVAPLPDPPEPALLTTLNNLGDNELLVRMHEQKQQLVEYFETWGPLAETARIRLRQWEAVGELRDYARALPVAAKIGPDADAIREGRLLLEEPNPLSELSRDLESELRRAIVDKHEHLETAVGSAVEDLESRDEWSRLDAAVRKQLLEAHVLNPTPAPEIGTLQALLVELRNSSLEHRDDAIAATPARAGAALLEAVRLQEPQAVSLRPRSATLRDVEDVDAYVEELRSQLLAKIEMGTPVTIT